MKRIGRRAFENCRFICTLSLPASLERVESFSGCQSLSGVEIPFASDEEDETEFQPRVLAKCHLLANVSVLASVDNTQVFKNCTFLNSVRECNRGYVALLIDRYHDLPIYQACYYASSTTVDELKSLVELYDDDVLQNDVYGLSPFRILALSPKVRLDLLDVLLDKFGLDPLSFRDNRNGNMLDYLRLTNHLPLFLSSKLYSNEQ